MVMTLTLALLFVATVVHGVIGHTEASAVSRVMRIILATIAVDAVFGGFDAFAVLHGAPATIENAPAGAPG